MASRKNAAPDEERNEPTPVEEIPDWLADNYRGLIANGDRNDSFTKLADRSDGALAAWARREAAKAGEDVTPTRAKSKTAATRGADES